MVQYPNEPLAEARRFLLVPGVGLIVVAVVAVAVLPSAFGVPIAIWQLAMILGLGVALGLVLVLVMPGPATRYVPNPIGIEGDRLVIPSPGGPGFPYPPEVGYDRVTRVLVSGFLPPRVSWTPLPGEKRQGPNASLVLTRENAERVKTAWESWKVAGKR